MYDQTNGSRYDLEKRQTNELTYIFMKTKYRADSHFFNNYIHK